MGVVHFFEVIDVEHEQESGFSGACDAIYFALKHCTKVPAVGKARERVFKGKFAKAVDDALQIPRRYLAVQRRFAAASLSDQRVRSVQAKIAQIN